jgi:hypothetical protein
MRRIIININEIEMLTSVVAGLTRESLAFTVEEQNRCWVIEITGF